MKFRGAETSRLAATAGRLLLFVSPLLCFTVSWIFTASRRPLWHDELYTLHIATQPTVGALWRLLLTGVDQTPPSFYLLMRGSIDLFGASPLAMRIPAVLGFLAMTVFVFLAVRRRYGATAGLLAAVLPLVTAAYRYSYEARSYALVLGAVAAAFFCWQSYISGKRPRLALLGLAVAGMVGVALHYYALLALLPIVAGEVTRALIARRVDPWPWSALAAAALPLFAFAPLIEASRTYAKVFWTIPYGTSLAGLYPSLVFWPTLLTCGVLGCAVVIAAFRRLGSARDARRAAFSVPEFTAAIAFLLLPLIAAVVGQLTVGAFTSRYALAGVIGVSLLVPAAVSYVDYGRARIATTGLVILTVVLSLDHMASRYRAVANVDNRQATKLRMLESSYRVRRKVVMADPYDFVELSHVASPRLRRSLVYLTDPNLALRFTKTDSVDKGFPILARFMDFDVQPYSSYVAGRERFTVFSSVIKARRRGRQAWIVGSPPNWLLPALGATGREVKLRARHGKAVLLSVSGQRGTAVTVRRYRCSADLDRWSAPQVC